MSEKIQETVIAVPGKTPITISKERLDKLFAEAEKNKRPKEPPESKEGQIMEKGYNGTIFAVPCNTPVTISREQLERIREEAKQNRLSGSDRNKLANEVKALLTKPEKNNE